MLLLVDLFDLSVPLGRFHFTSCLRDTTGNDRIFLQNKQNSTLRQLSLEQLPTLEDLPFYPCENPTFWHFRVIFGHQE